MGDDLKFAPKHDHHVPGTVSELFIEDCLQTGHLLDPKDYKNLHHTASPFHGLRLLFASPNLIGRLQKVCRDNGAMIVDTDPDICVATFQEDIPVGINQCTVLSPFWIEMVLRRQKVVPPFHVLHFPCRLAPIISEDEPFIATVTGGDRESRATAETMIRLLGGTFTPFLTTANTHVIVLEDRNQKSEKIMRAREWGIPCRSIAWLERCFEQWKLLDE